MNVVIQTESDVDFYLVFCDEQNPVKVSKSNNLNIVVDYYKSLKDVSNVVVK